MTSTFPFAHDAYGFVTKVLGVTPEPWQAEALKAISDKPRVAIRAAHNVGKTALLSWTVVWFLLTRRNAIVPVVTSSAAQGRDVCWRELTKWIRSLPPPMKALVEVAADRITVRNYHSYCVARVASKDTPEALQGFHGENLLFVLEEASGIDDIVFEVAGGALASANSKCLMVGNPTRPDGFFHAAHTVNRAHWHCLQVPWYPTPFSSPTYADEIAGQYGENSNVYRIRVRGEFPVSKDDAVIPLPWLEAAVNRDVAVKADRGVVWGVDVGRGGDPSCLVKRHGNHILEPAKHWPDANTMMVAGRVVREWRETPDKLKPSTIAVDVIGVGAGVHDRLLEIGLPAIAVNVGETISLEEPERFVRRRDELWWGVREWLAIGDVRLPNDPVLIAELSGPGYKTTSAGKLQVESKDELKARGLKSPNAADALCLTFHGGEYSNLYRRQSHAISDFDPFASPRERAAAMGRADASPGWGVQDVRVGFEDEFQTHAITTE